MDKKSLLDRLEKQIQECKKCSLWEEANRSVPGEGDPAAEIFFIGEGPGFHEDREGRPFVGQAGKLLDKLLDSVELSREKVFIGNVIKHRPPENRDPTPTEILACKYWLDQQLEIINPKIIVTLGRYSMARFLPTAKISEVHGKPVRVKNSVVLPMYHPAAALRSGNVLNVIKDDFKKNIEAFRNPGDLKNIENSKTDDDDPNQMSFFNN